jgi:hypothetical protein
MAPLEDELNHDELNHDELNHELEDKFGRTFVPNRFNEHYNALKLAQEDSTHTGLGPNSGMYIIDPSLGVPETMQIYTSGEHAGEPVDAVHCCDFYDR